MEIKEVKGPFDYVNTIFYNKVKLDNLAFYNPFLINRALSYHVDCVLYANEMNRLTDIPHEYQYQYYLINIRKNRRTYTKWGKKTDKNYNEDVKMLQRYYKINKHNAEDYRGLLKAEDLEAIREEMSENDN